MENEEQDAPEVLETSEGEIELELGDESEDTTTDEEKETLRKENAELKSKNAQLFERAKKNKSVETAAPATLGTADIYALVQAGVPQEDIEEVSDYAALKKISIAEALKASTVKTILAERKEARDVAEATNTGRVRRQSAATSPEALLENASAGKLPETDAGLKSLAEARMERRKAALRR